VFSHHLWRPTRLKVRTSFNSVYEEEDEEDEEEEEEEEDNNGDEDEDHEEVHE